MVVNSTFAVKSGKYIKFPDFLQKNGYQDRFGLVLGEINFYYRFCKGTLS
jgi:hypothetical protein